MPAKIHHEQVYVQNSHTHRFLTRDLRWTDDAAEAEDFGTAVDALAFCLNRNLNEAQVLVHCHSWGDYDVVVSVTAPAFDD